MHLSQLSPSLFSDYFFNSLRLSCADFFDFTCPKMPCSPHSKVILFPATLPHSQSSCGLLIQFQAPIFLMMGKQSIHPTLLGVRVGSRSFQKWSSAPRFSTTFPKGKSSWTLGSPLLRYSCISLLILTKFHKVVEASSVSSFYKFHKNPDTGERMQTR